MERKLVINCAIASIIVFYILSVSSFQIVNGCYGPHITAQISSNQININENVTVTGEICPGEPNVTIRVTFTRPNYTSVSYTHLTLPTILLV